MRTNTGVPWPGAVRLRRKGGGWETTETPIDYLAPGCNCWLSSPEVSDDTRFQARYGAHSLACPAYRQSGDPVDRQYDNAVRQHGERGKIGRRHDAKGRIRDWAVDALVSACGGAV